VTDFERLVLRYLFAINIGVAVGNGILVALLVVSA
jgi:hypothetical protein